MVQECGVRREARAQYSRSPGKILYCHQYHKCNSGVTSRSASTLSWGAMEHCTQPNKNCNYCAIQEILACLLFQVNTPEFPTAALPESSNQNVALSIHFAVAKAVLNSRILAVTGIPQARTKCSETLWIKGAKLARNQRTADQCEIEISLPDSVPREG